MKISKKLHNQRRPDHYLAEGKNTAFVLFMGSANAIYWVKPLGGVVGRRVTRAVADAYNDRARLRGSSSQKGLPGTGYRTNYRSVSTPLSDCLE